MNTFDNKSGQNENKLLSTVFFTELSAEAAPPIVTQKFYNFINVFSLMSNNPTQFKLYITTKIH